MQNRQRDVGRGGAEVVPQQGDGELHQQTNFPFAARLAWSNLTYHFTETFIPR